VAFNDADTLAQTSDAAPTWRGARMNARQFSPPRDGPHQRVRYHHRRQISQISALWSRSGQPVEPTFTLVPTDVHREELDRTLRRRMFLGETARETLSVSNCSIG
jgi:hypothetical protein